MKNPLILTLDQSGVPTQWSTWQTAVTYQAKGLVSWDSGEIEFTFHGGNNRDTGERTIVTVPSIIALKTTKTRKYRTPVLNNTNLFRRDLNICAYCTKVFQDKGLTRDHILPTSKDGANTWMNCVTSCKRCNNKKDDNLLENINMELHYAPYVPDMAEAMILRNRTILADQMQFLLNYLPAHSRARKLLSRQQVQ